MINMLNNSRKVLSSFLLAAILVIAGGFSDGMIVSAETLPINDGMHVQNQIMHDVESDSVLHESMPLGNSLKPCCEDKQGGASAIQASTFRQDDKISSTNSLENISDNNSVFENKLTELSSVSPPRPDVLSSILKKE